MKVEFQAKEYTQDDQFILTNYEYEGDEKTGWDIRRNGNQYLHLGTGYRLLKTNYCGICSTDIDRRFLPFPLPQVTGHEVVVEDINSKSVYTVEINDTDEARGDISPDIFCNSGIPTHSPTRMVLGIDRLPGGFAKFILAPKNALVPIGSISEKVAVLTEPFAAALQAVMVSAPKDGVQVAVLGPRRLGSLVIAALVAYRNSFGKKFTITSLARHDHLLQLSKVLGADDGINLTKIATSSIYKKFDIIFDTTANPDGFLSALNFSKSIVHLKSTNGQTISGLRHLTEMVVDEIALLPFHEKYLDFHWEFQDWKNKKIYVSSSLVKKLNIQNREIFSGNLEDLKLVLKSDSFRNRIPRFDLAIVDSLEEIDFVLRPDQNSEESILRPRGAILFSGNDNKNPILEFLNTGGQIHSSRCGDFHLALKLLQDNPELTKILEQKMISHEFSEKDLEKAFETAKNSKSVKVIIKHD